MPNADPVEPEAQEPPLDGSPRGVAPLARRALIVLGIAIGAAFVVELVANGSYDNGWAGEWPF